MTDLLRRIWDDIGILCTVIVCVLVTGWSIWAMVTSIPNDLRRVPDDGCVVATEYRSGTGKERVWRTYMACNGEPYHLVVRDGGTP